MPSRGPYRRLTRHLAQPPRLPPGIVVLLRRRKPLASSLCHSHADLYIDGKHRGSLYNAAGDFPLPNVESRRIADRIAARLGGIVIEFCQEPQ